MEWTSPAYTCAKPAQTDASMYQLNPALKDFWLTPARNKVLHGGRASSKSHDAAGFAVFLAANYHLKFLCARQFQNRISESVYTLIKDKVEASEFNGEFTFTKASIKHKVTGSEFLFYGIARNLSEIKSTEGVDILWLEEAHYLTAEQWEVINPTIRKKGSQIWLIFNPDEYMDFVYQNFVVNPPAGTVVKEINFDSNPFLSDTMLDVIHEAYRRDRKNAEHIYGGQVKMGQDKSVINLNYILASIDAHKRIAALDAGKPNPRVWELAGPKRLGFDIADDGGDTNAVVEAHGNIATYCEEWEGLEDQLLNSSSRVYNLAVERGADITFDTIGVGANAGPKFKELNESRKLSIKYEAFNAGGGIENPDAVFMKLPHTVIKNKDHFANIKAQKWAEVAERFRKTYEVMEQGASHPVDELISIDTSTFPEKLLGKLKQELSVPKKDLDGNGRFKVESKKDLKARGIKSPNIADAFIMAFIKPKRAAKGFFD